MLRHFSYLDTRALDQYLGQLEGSLLEDLDKRTAGSKGGAVSVGYEKLGANASARKEIEVTERREITASAKFEAFHRAMMEKGEIQYLDAFDEGIWQQLQRGEFLEIQASIRLPESTLLVKNVPAIKNMIRVMDQLGQETFKEPGQAEQYQAMMDLISEPHSGEIPILFRALSTPEYAFASKLSENHLGIETEELEGEATVIGKIIRLIPQGKSEEFSGITPQISGLMKLMNRQQQQSAKGKEAPSLAVEIVEGPAAILAVLAIFV